MASNEFSEDDIEPDEAAFEDESVDEIEEELRLFYVALTRAKNWLYVCCPLRYYYYPHGKSDSHGYALRTRFLPERLLPYFECATTGPGSSGEASDGRPGTTDLTSEAIRRRTKGYW